MSFSLFRKISVQYSVICIDVTIKVVLNTEYLSLSGTYSHLLYCPMDIVKKF